MKNIKIYLVLLSIFFSFSCKKYLDVIPDNLATIESAFSSRTTAEKYLFTCYDYMPQHGNPHHSAFLISDEVWMATPQVTQYYFNLSFEDIALNRQNMVSPTLDYWDGTKGGFPMFRALRDCNIFLENIDAVPGMQDIEKNRWIAEVKFLKAYYHFWLLRMYGPIPLIKENIPVYANIEEVKVKREPVDACFDYIVQLLDEASPDLPETITSETSEQGRITKSIALTVKASILVTAASPLFNGNAEFAGFKDKDNVQLFNPAYSDVKWKTAVDACREAITACENAGIKLYKYAPIVNTFNLAPSTIIQMGIRNSVTEKWNSEIIWANTNSMATEVQALAQAYVDPTRLTNMGARSVLSPTLKMAELFYTENGVPINEDHTWDYDGRYNVKTAATADRFNLQPGYETASLHFKRENRFYANLGFDGGVWYGQGRYDDKAPWLIKAKFNQHAGKKSIIGFSATGYFVKKLVNFQNIIEAGDAGPYTVKAYPWPVVRLADLYLLYAEALNEFSGPSGEAYKWINLVRERAGLKSVEESWTSYSRLSSKHTTKDGLRDIIQQERQIETAFEGNRYWDIMRWKKGRELFNQPVKGWDIDQDLAQNYYRVRTIFNRKFSTKDYFWPISENNLLINKKLVQNPGW
jgi:hypothetical protein